MCVNDVIDVVWRQTAGCQALCYVWIGREWLTSRDMFLDGFRISCDASPDA